MSRARIWISEVRAIGHAFIIEHDDGRLESHPLRTPPAKGDRLGAPYRGEFKGFEGTYYDLPFGFPTTNELAQQRLSDPSIPAVMKKLIQENFPLKTITQTIDRPHPAEARAPHVAEISDGERILGQLLGAMIRPA